METIKRILVILNPDDELHIEIDHALKIASQTKARIDVVAFRHHSELALLKNTEYSEQLKGNLEAISMASVSERISTIKNKGVNISAHVEWCDHMAISAIDYVKEQAVDLLIKAPNKVSTLNHLVTTPTDWGLLRTCPCPVWLAKPQTQFSGGVLAAVDVSSQSETLATRVLHQANYYSHILGAELHALNAFPCMPVGAKVQFVGIYEADYENEIKTQHQQALAKLASSVDMPESRQHVYPGVTQQVICDYLKENSISLLVTGTSARTGVSALLTGNTVESIIANVDCDILVIKSSE